MSQVKALAAAEKERTQPDTDEAADAGAGAVGGGSDRREIPLELGEQTVD